MHLDYLTLSVPVARLLSFGFVLVLQYLCVNIQGQVCFTFNTGPAQPSHVTTATALQQHQQHHYHRTAPADLSWRPVGKHWQRRAQQSRAG